MKGKILLTAAIVSGVGLVHSTDFTMWGIEDLGVSTRSPNTLARADAEIVVAVVDSGVDTRHPDLKNNLDPRGWNFTENNADVNDSNGHGTHIAGIILQVAPTAKILPIKYYDPKSSGEKNLRDTIQSFRYAIKMGVDIINYSGGGPAPSEEEMKVMQEASAAGILVVAAAGNMGRHLTKTGFYPATYKLPNILSVAAHKPDHDLIAASNYGSAKVDMSAPGYDIYSAIPGGKNGLMTGTSQATAFATGIAARLLIEKTHLRRHPAAIIQHIGSTGVFSEKLEGKTRFWTRANLARALKIMDQNADAFGQPINHQQPIQDQTFSSEHGTALAESLNAVLMN